MSNSFHKSMTIISAIYIVIGLLLVLWPDGARFVICYALGAAAFLYGAYRVIRYFTQTGTESGVRFGFALGVACAVLGLFLLFKANAVVTVLAGAAGMAVIVESVIRLQVGLDQRHAEGRLWLAICLSAVVMLLFGIVLLFNPFAVVRAATIVAGVALVLDGGLTLWGLVQSSRRMHRRTVVVH